MALPNSVIYWSGHQQNTSDQAVSADVVQSFNEVIIKNPSNWMIAVERFELNLNGVPFYDGGLAQLGFTNLGGGLGMPPITLSPTYSLPELVESIEQQVQATGFAPALNFSIGIDKHGYIVIRWADFPNYSIDISEDLSIALGFPRTTLSASAVLRSATPRFDTGDSLNHVVLRTNLPVVSDRIGQVLTKTLADFSAVKNFSASVQLDATENETGRGYSYSPRQQMIYIPQEKRFVNLSGNAPIDQIQITGYYTDHRNRTRPISLPKGAGFSIKIGFYSKR